MKKKPEAKPAPSGIRPDQEARLAALQERLLDVFLTEADPDTFVKVEATASAKEQQNQRGDRCWQKKDANQTITLVAGIERLLRERRNVAPPKPGEDGPDDAAEIRTMEKAAGKRLALVKKRQ
ncbi:MAG TPA: hypothetical protein VI298_08735 [Geobacteraceae bacterium]